jgi:tRNA dimethylallyltransferase
VKDTERPLTPVLVGPTGVGKTAVAVALAALTPITVISADARQIYRGLDVGTAKPDHHTLTRVPHRGLDLIDPGERYSAGRFARDAAAWLAEIRNAARQPIVVGGTGLYIRALAEGLFHEPPFDATRREQVRTWSESLEGPQLARWAGRLDPRFPGGGRQRAARAIEVALLTGRALSWWQREARESGTLRPWYIHLTVPREVLHRRLSARVDQMLGAGLVAEVQRHLDAGVAPDAAGLDGIGYREVIAMLNGQLSESALRDAILVSTRRYAKRQETWFRNQLRAPYAERREPYAVRRTPEIWTLDATEMPERVAAMIHDRWKTAHGARRTAHDSGTAHDS